MKVEKPVVSAEGDHVVIYAQVGNVIIGIQLDPEEADILADDLRDRAAIIFRAIRRERGLQ